ncbi:hypothetical protein EK21DRAFT_84992 [Setomelanomma holmii]|uniref:Heterokaryon incompatibility domain-containing protein n=1 Tax=Setomelanomma holmii TaxID=210430 RepID=A0A9P4HI55_9PLEO|nr:hypothetical protein EK21DRAFT_84992 [Setomelanomma holmii]
MGFFTIAASAWWTRMWTVQESILPHDCVITYASYQANWALLDCAYGNWLAHTLGCCYQPYKDYFSAEWELTRRSFFDFDSRRATNPRDYVYGLLDLAKKEYAAKIVSDYEADVSRVYTQPLRAILNECRSDLRPLTRHVFNTDTIGLLYWVPDFAMHKSALAKREECATGMVRAVRCFPGLQG